MSFTSRPKRRRECARVVEMWLRTGPGATVAEIRDLLGTTRKFAVPLCEYLDRIGLDERDGDFRVLTIPTPWRGRYTYAICRLPAS
ncbi:MAG: SelB C-terminal domain-containing protein [Gemmataceae bacterium]